MIFLHVLGRAHGWKRHEYPDGHVSVNQGLALCIIMDREDSDR